MFPDLREQELLTRTSAAELAVSLMHSPSVLIAAVHDIVLTLKDEEKAKLLLAEAIANFGNQKIVEMVIEVLLVRLLKDDASFEEERPYLEFCQRNGLQLPILIG